ncbi:hypothetical protein [Roseivirga pacifica]|uniref:hypothetical protein n=1 Tax=Roseivirga pacifica TaxID=1267423 RepID=UPI002094411F|nr:hypothetical protein [Roseivirga pacifica]
MKKPQIIIILILLFTTAVFAYKAFNLKQRVVGKDNIIAEQNATIDSVVLKNGNIAYSQRAAQADLKSLKQGYSFLEDSLRNMGLKVKHLQNAVFLARQTSASGSGKIDTVKIVEQLPGTTDTVLINRQLNISERFFKFKADLFANDTYNYEYTFTDSLSIVNTTSRKNWFAPRVYNVRVVSANPNTRLTGITSLAVKEEGTRWSLSIFGGYGWNGQQFSPTIGIGVSREIIKF